MLPNLTHIFIQDEEELERMVKRIFKCLPTDDSSQDHIVASLERLFPTLTIIPEVVVKEDETACLFIFTNEDDAAEFKIRYMGK